METDILKIDCVCMFPILCVHRFLHLNTQSFGHLTPRGERMFSHHPFGTRLASADTSYSIETIEFDLKLI